MQLHCPLIIHVGHDDLELSLRSHASLKPACLPCYSHISVWDILRDSSKDLCVESIMVKVKQIGIAMEVQGCLQIVVRIYVMVLGNYYKNKKEDR